MAKTARQRWKAAYGKLRSIANDEKSGKISAVLMGQSVTVYSRHYRTASRLDGFDTDAARRARYLSEATRLTFMPAWDNRMTRWNKNRARAHINLARENTISVFIGLNANDPDGRYVRAA